MQTLLLGVLLLVVILLAGRYYVQADPARMARLMRRGGVLHPQLMVLHDHSLSWEVGTQGH
jgi:hypothetical protein